MIRQNSEIRQLHVRQCLRSVIHVLISKSETLKTCQDSAKTAEGTFRIKVLFLNYGHGKKSIGPRSVGIRLQEVSMSDTCLTRTRDLFEVPVLISRKKMPILQVASFLYISAFMNNILFDNKYC